MDNNSNAINAIIGKNPADFKDAVTNELGRKLHLALDRAREAVAASSLNRSAPVEEEAIAEGTTQNDAKKIVALIRAEFDESNPSESPYMMAYSGRGMMGKYCLGVSIPMRWDHERWLKMLREKRIQTPSGDALGMGSVLYWPNIPWDKEMFKNPHPKKYEFDEGLIHTPTEGEDILGESANGYICHYDRKKVEVKAETTLKAREKAAEMLKVPASKKHMISVMLADVDGKQYTHTPTESVEIQEAANPHQFRVGDAVQTTVNGKSVRGVVVKVGKDALMIAVASKKYDIAKHKDEVRYLPNTKNESTLHDPRSYGRGGVADSYEAEGDDIQEKVEIDGRTRAYRNTVARLEQARKSRTPLTQGSPADKYAGLYDDGSGKGASVPSPLDINPSRFQHITGVTEQVVDESSDKYKKFFKSALKKFGVNSPADLKGDKKKRFFDYVEKNWKGEEE